VAANVEAHVYVSRVPECCCDNANAFIDHVELYSARIVTRAPTLGILVTLRLVEHARCVSCHLGDENQGEGPKFANTGSVLTVGRSQMRLNSARETMSSTKRAAAGVISPLEHAGILLHMLDILRPGQHLFISPVSKAWRETYRRVASVHVSKVYAVYRGLAATQTISSQTTLYSAAFASASRISLAHGYGLQFASPKLQYIAGRISDVATLQVAHALGLLLTEEVLIGAAAAAASIPKLQWLHTEQGCPLLNDVSNYAARCGSIETLRWLREHGCAFTTETCEGAAAGGHLHVLRFLRAEHCDWDEGACFAAAYCSQLPTLKWLHEQGCPWEVDGICWGAAASKSGSIETMRYLLQQGCVLDDDTLASAAWEGNLALCQYLVAEQCPLHIVATSNAAAAGHLEILRFLHDNGCPWDAEEMCSRAALSGSVEVLQYVQQEGCGLSEEAMSTAAARGFLRMCQYLRTQQCPWSEKACELAAAHGHVDTLRWLHQQGCPCNVPAFRVAAAIAGHTAVIEYLLGVQPAACAEQLTEMLFYVGAYNHLAAVKWLRQHGAEWPALLTDGNGLRWRDDVLLWARDEGCTAPVPDSIWDDE
jgi:hypothetical protein